MTHRERAARIHELMHGYHCEDATGCVHRIEVEITAAVKEYFGSTPLPLKATSIQKASPLKFVEYIDKPFEDHDLAGWAGPGWYYWDESQAQCYGPHETRQQAQWGLDGYVRSLGNDDYNEMEP